MEKIAFYGTLMSKFPPRAGRPDLSPHIEKLGPCKIKGKIYKIGPYPGLVKGEGEVIGELWQTKTPEALKVLDRWEGSEFKREPTLLISPPQFAWVYFYDLEVKGFSQIESGYWQGEK